MSGFIKGDELKVDEELLAEAGIDEVLQLESVESFLIEGVLEVFELKRINRGPHNNKAGLRTYSQRELQDGDVDFREF
jgi:hypothetical protein